MRLAAMPHLPDTLNTNSRCSPSRGVHAIASLFTNIVAVPRSEDCFNGRSRCGMEGSLSPKRFNGIANEHDPTQRAGLQYAVKPDSEIRVVVEQTFKKTAKTFPPSAVSPHVSMLMAIANQTGGKIMNKKVAIFALILGMFFYSMAYAYDGRSWQGGDPQGHGRKHGPHRLELLTELPEEKAVLFLRTIREVRENTQGIREQIRELRSEIKDILTAPEFNDALFLQKTGQIHELRGQKHTIMDEAIVKLAKQFTAEERKVLAELMPRKPGRHGRPHDKRGL
jgi:uncharacterized membrane protein